MVTKETISVEDRRQLNQPTSSNFLLDKVFLYRVNRHSAQSIGERDETARFMSDVNVQSFHSCLKPYLTGTGGKH